MTVWCRTVLVALVAAVTLPAGWPAAQPAPQETSARQVAIDPQTGRAIGAREMTPESLRTLIDRKAPLLVIDVRDEAQFEAETIKGAVHVPFADLEARLKDLPKDTILAFT